MLNPMVIPIMSILSGNLGTGNQLCPDIGVVFWFSGDIILFPDEYNSILIRTEINVPEIPKMNADNK